MSPSPLTNFASDSSAEWKETNFQKECFEHKGFTCKYDPTRHAFGGRLIKKGYYIATQNYTSSKKLVEQNNRESAYSFNIDFMLE